MNWKGVGGGISESGVSNPRSSAPFERLDVPFDEDLRPSI
jgi:hypothetical protein